MTSESESVPLLDDFCGFRGAFGLRFDFGAFGVGFSRYQTHNITTPVIHVLTRAGPVVVPPASAIVVSSALFASPDCAAFWGLLVEVLAYETHKIATPAMNVLTASAIAVSSALFASPD